MSAPKALCALPFMRCNSNLYKYTPPIKYGELTSMLSRQLGDTTHSGEEK